jgi:hypothetical protein
MITLYESEKKMHYTFLSVSIIKSMGETYHSLDVKSLPVKMIRDQVKPSILSPVRRFTTWQRYLRLTSLLSTFDISRSPDVRI